jgi:hypothetical protein
MALAGKHIFTLDGEIVNCANVAYYQTERVGAAFGGGYGIVAMLTKSSGRDDERTGVMLGRWDSAEECAKAMEWLMHQLGNNLPAVEMKVFVPKE